ncbi:MAG: Gram-negative bacterial tonB protein [Bacteroidetes bacterium]|nr:Gram-negative bacterial tonB protein [Bacteroidota bacterium]
MRAVFLLLIILVTCCRSTFAQQKSETKPVLVYVEVMPVFPGGEDSLMRFIADHFSLPDREDVQGVSGKVIVRITINENGHVSDAGILKSLHPLYNKEALRVVRLLPPFKPGLRQGKPIKTEYLIPMNFRSGIQY